MKSLFCSLAFFSFSHPRVDRSRIGTFFARCMIDLIRSNRSKFQLLTTRVPWRAMMAVAVAAVVMAVAVTVVVVTR